MKCGNLYGAVVDTPETSGISSGAKRDALRKLNFPFPPGINQFFMIQIPCYIVITAASFLI